jgi:hypothetical protein
MPYLPLNVPPGVVRNGTKYQAKGRWIDSNLVRWHEGVMRPIGGVVTASTAWPVPGTVRQMAWWMDGNQQSWAFATDTKLWGYAVPNVIDITPAGYSGGWLSIDAFSAPLNNVNRGFILAVASNLTLYYWTNGMAAALPATDAPTGHAIVTTPEHFAVVLGAGNSNNRVFWADQEGFDDWNDTDPNNQAGWFDVQTRGRLLAGQRARGETLLWTNVDLWSMRYIGLPLVHSFQRLGDQCGAIAANSMATVDTRAFWMGANGFYTYDGYVQPLPCDVSDYVFGRLNQAQLDKIRCVSISAFNEIWWFYPSTGSTENNSYVVYNHAERHWATGAFGRSAAILMNGVPLMAAPGGGLWTHEAGTDTSTLGTVYAETGPVELGEGDNVLHARALVPDEKTVGDTTVTFYAAQTPTSAETTHGPYTLSHVTDVRFGARQVRMRIQQVNPGWRVGVPRLEVVPGGLR